MKPSNAGTQPTIQKANSSGLRKGTEMTFREIKKTPPTDLNELLTIRDELIKNAEWSDNPEAKELLLESSNTVLNAFDEISSLRKELKTAKSDRDYFMKQLIEKTSKKPF